MIRSTTNSLSRIAATLAAFALSAGMATAAGCSGEDAQPSSDGPTPLVEVPEVKGDVAAADFCAVANEISCAGSVGCCSTMGAGFASADECIQASHCDVGLGKVLASPLLQDGTLQYDAAAAGDYLRALASRISFCDAPAAETAKPSFLVGSRDEGADCSPQGNDRTNTFSCKTGLQCVLSEDAATGAPVGVCSKVADVPMTGNAGDTCTTDEDCHSGPCDKGACAFDRSSFYCAKAPEISAPSNTDPTQLYIKTHDSTSAGTSGTLTLKYVAGTTQWSCDVKPTNKNTEYTCTPTSTTVGSGSSFYMTTNSGDGVRISTVCARYQASGSTSWSAVECAGTFFDYGNNDGWSEGCTWDPTSWGSWCSNVWVDSDGNGSCSTLKVNYNNDNYTNCNP